MSKNPANLLNLLTIAKAIEANNAKASTVPRGPIAVADLIPAEPAPRMGGLQPQRTDVEREAANESAYRGALAEVERLRRELSEMTEARRICVDRIATLTRELAEARADRAAEDRTAERVQVRTDAEAWHFLTPQGEGTADRIKACGGRWVFHKRSERDKHRAAGYWLVPFSPEAGELLINLRFADKRIDVRPL